MDAGAAANREGGWCVFDRYYHDYLVDYDQKQVSLPDWCVRIFLLLLPAPDLTVVLLVPAEEVRRRKPDLTEPEIERQNQSFVDLAAHFRGVTVVPNLDEPRLVSERIIARVVAPAK